MAATSSEKLISKINENVFFKEFTFDKNSFKHLDSNSELEFADNVVWLDDLLFIIQIKERNSKEGGDLSKWFKNKVLNKAVKQIKATNNYLSSLSDVVIQNLKGHKKNIIESRTARKRSIIIYSTNNEIDESIQFQKFYESSDIGLIHLFYVEDYLGVCDFLHTPAEVEEYLEFREAFYKAQGKILNHIPEQYLAAHFFETLDVDHINFDYMDNFKKVSESNELFDISFIIREFSTHLPPLSDPTEYYPIIAELAKLNRAELVLFKTRFLRACMDAEETEMVNITPYRMYVPRTDCAFAIIPLCRPFHEYWETARNNATSMLMYEHKCFRSVGVCIFYAPGEEDFLQTKWQFIEDLWVRNPEMEDIIKEHFPFRKATFKTLNDRYGLHDDNVD